jgi:hypothetical protein
MSQLVMKTGLSEKTIRRHLKILIQNHFVCCMYEGRNGETEKHYSINMRRESEEFSNNFDPRQNAGGPPAKCRGQKKLRQKICNKVVVNKKDTPTPQGVKNSPTAHYSHEQKKIKPPDKPKKPDKIEIDRISEPLSDESRSRLEYKFGKDVVSKKEANLEEHLKKYPHSFKKKSREEVIYEWCVQESKKNTGKKGKGMLDENLARQNREQEQIDARKEAHRVRMSNKIKELVSKNPILGSFIGVRQTPSSFDVLLKYGDGRTFEKSAYDPMFESYLKDWVNSHGNGPRINDPKKNE